MLCDHCHSRDAVLFCDDCNNFFCTSGPCDSDVHTKLQDHQRFRLGVHKKRYSNLSRFASESGRSAYFTHNVGLERYVGAANAWTRNGEQKYSLDHRDPVYKRVSNLPKSEPQALEPKNEFRQWELEAIEREEQELERETKQIIASEKLKLQYMDDAMLAKEAEHVRNFYLQQARAKGRQLAQVQVHQKQTQNELNQFQHEHDVLLAGMRSEYSFQSSLQKVLAKRREFLEDKLQEYQLLRGQLEEERDHNERVFRQWEEEQQNSQFAGSLAHSLQLQLWKLQEIYQYTKEELELVKADLTENELLQDSLTKATEDALKFRAALVEERVEKQVETLSQHQLQAKRIKEQVKERERCQNDIESRRVELDRRINDFEVEKERLEVEKQRHSTDLKRAWEEYTAANEKLQRSESEERAKKEALELDLIGITNRNVLYLQQRDASQSQLERERCEMEDRGAKRLERDRRNQDSGQAVETDSTLVRGKQVQLTAAELRALREKQPRDILKLESRALKLQAEKDKVQQILQFEAWRTKQQLALQHEREENQRAQDNLLKHKLATLQHEKEKWQAQLEAFKVKHQAEQDAKDELHKQVLATLSRSLADDAKQRRQEEWLRKNEDRSASKSLEFQQSKSNINLASTIKVTKSGLSMSQSQTERELRIQMHKEAARKKKNLAQKAAKRRAEKGLPVVGTSGVAQAWH